MRPVAKRGDRIRGTSTHMHLKKPPAPPPAPPELPTPVRQDYNGQFGTDLSPDVYAENREVATVGSEASMRPGLRLTPPQLYVPPTGPSNGSEVIRGSSTVYVNGKQIARDRDPCNICGVPMPTPTGHVEARGTVYADP